MGAAGPSPHSRGQEGGNLGGSSGSCAESLDLAQGEAVSDGFQVRDPYICVQKDWGGGVRAGRGGGISYGQLVEGVWGMLLSHSSKRNPDLFAHLLCHVSALDNPGHRFDP